MIGRCCYLFQQFICTNSRSVVLVRFSGFETAIRRAKDQASHPRQPFERRAGFIDCVAHSPPSLPRKGRSRGGLQVAFPFASEKSEGRPSEIISGGFRRGPLIFEEWKRPYLPMQGHRWSAHAPEEARLMRATRRRFKRCCSWQEPERIPALPSFLPATDSELLRTRGVYGSKTGDGLDDPSRLRLRRRLLPAPAADLVLLRDRIPPSPP